MGLGLGLGDSNLCLSLPETQIERGFVSRLHSLHPALQRKLHPFRRDLGVAPLSSEAEAEHSFELELDLELQIEM